MPGTAATNKQNVLGGIAGLALLAFALTYRFFPGIVHAPPQQPPEIATRAPASRAVANWTAVEAPPAKSTAPVAAAPQGTTLAEAIAMGPPAPTTRVVRNMLDRALAAEHRGQLIEPKDASALTLYREVLEHAPGNAEAAAGLARIGGALRDWTLAAIDRGDEADADRYLALFAELPHSDQELANVRERVKTLRTVTPLLAKAADDMKNGRLVGAGTDNALTLYRKVLSIDAGNKLADAGLATIEQSYLDRALAAAAQEHFDQADAILADAATIRPGSQALLDTRGRIEDLRRRRAETILAQARSALDAGNPDLAEQLARQAQSVSSDLAGLDEFNVKLRNARLYASFSPGQVIHDRFLDIKGSAPALVVVPTGRFQMGSSDADGGAPDNEEPRHEVTIANGFALGQTEVTVAQFGSFVRATGYQTDAERSGSSSIYDENTGRMTNRHGVTWRDDYSGQPAGGALPVVNVSWNDAVAYLEWLTQHTGKHYRLPSEAEYEYALRAGSTTRYPWGDGNPTAVVGNFTGSGERSPSRRSWAHAFAKYDDGYWGPAPVGKYPANRFGLYDMDGNVSEWVADCWHDNYVRAPHDGSAWVNPGCDRHVIRGGSWGSDPDQVRSAFRFSAPADTRSGRVGFRIARSL